MSNEKSFSPAFFLFVLFLDVKSAFREVKTLRCFVICQAHFAKVLRGYTSSSLL